MTTPTTPTSAPSSDKPKDIGKAQAGFVAALTPPAAPSTPPAATPAPTPAVPGTPPVTPAKEPEMTPEEQEVYIQKLVAEREETERLAAWRKDLTPQAQAYWNAKSEVRKQQIAATMKQQAAAAMGTPPAVPQPGQPPVPGQQAPTPGQPAAPAQPPPPYGQPPVPVGAMSSLALRQPIQTVNEEIFGAAGYRPLYVNEEALRLKYGINAREVPANIAEGLSRLINDHNNLISNATYIHREAKESFRDRDASRNELLKYEWRDSIRSAGYEVTPTMDVLFEHARKLMIDPKTGAKTPLKDVVTRLSTQFPESFQKKAGSPAPSSVAPPPAAPSPAPAVPSAPVAGTTVSGHQTPAPQLQAGKVKDFNTARKGFADAMAASARKA